MKLIEILKLMKMKEVTDGETVDDDGEGDDEERGVGKDDDEDDGEKKR